MECLHLPGIYDCNIRNLTGVSYGNKAPLVSFGHANEGLVWEIDKQHRSENLAGFLREFQRGSVAERCGNLLFNTTIERIPASLAFKQT